MFKFHYTNGALASPKDCPASVRCLWEANSLNFDLPEAIIVYLLFFVWLLCNLHMALMSQKLRNTHLVFVWISYLSLPVFKPVLH